MGSIRYHRQREEPHFLARATPAGRLPTRANDSTSHLMSANERRRQWWPIWSTEVDGRGRSFAASFRRPLCSALSAAYGTAQCHLDGAPWSFCDGVILELVPCLSVARSNGRPQCAKQASAQLFGCVRDRRKELLGPLVLALSRDNEEATFESIAPPHCHMCGRQFQQENCQCQWPNLCAESVCALSCLTWHLRGVLLSGTCLVNALGRSSPQEEG